MAQGTTRKNFGGDALNPLKTGFICLFSGSVFFSTLGNNGWMNIQNMKRNWLDWFPPDYIVSRNKRCLNLSRSQTRLGAGLRSRSASCWPWCRHIGCLVNRDKGQLNHLPVEFQIGSTFSKFLKVSCEASCMDLSVKSLFTINLNYKTNILSQILSSD